MEEKVSKPVKRGGRYCVAGAPNGVPCQNTSYTEGIRMHQFPLDDKTREKWVNFVKRHRVDFGPDSVKKSTSLCSAHFEDRCYSRPALSLDTTLRRVLLPGAVPTRDTVVPETSEVISSRKKRQIRREAFAELDKPSTQSLAVPESDPDTSLDAVAEPSDPYTSAPSTSGLSSKSNIHPVSAFASTPSSTQINPTSTTTSSSRHCSQCRTQSKKCRILRKSNKRLKTRVAELKKAIKDLKSKPAMEESKSESELEAEAAEEKTNTKDIISPGVEDMISPGVASPDESESESEDEDEDEDGGGETTREAERDSEWVAMEENADESDQMDDSEDSVPEDQTRNDIRVDPSTPVQDEPKFVVFYSMLMQLFTLFCFKCKEGNPSAGMKQNGTMVTISQHCPKCGENAFVWRSQPLVLGKYPAGNILLSFGILMSGASICKTLLVFRHLGLAAYSSRTFFLHQKKFLFPVVLHYWESYRANLLNTLKSMKDIVWAGDGRFDSMGHSAKYGAYSMFSTTAMKIAHFEIVQANETGGSQQTELEGIKRCFSFLGDQNLPIQTFISDRHRSIAKWIRENHPGTKHFYDIWHVVKSITKKMLKASKEKGFEVIREWTRGVRNHIYWCATSTKEGFGDLIVAKWKSFMSHVSNVHTGFEDPLYKKCHHAEIEERKWIKLGTAPYDKLSKVLMKTSIVSDIRKLSPNAQTSCVEGFHATLNHWHPKMICFSWLGTTCRHILASLHFNENLQRETQTSRTGEKYYSITWPKFKVGEEVVREVACPPTYGYVNEIKKLLFSLSTASMKEILQKYNAKEPQPLVSQFEEKIDKKDAIKKLQEREGRENVLFPSVEEQNTLTEQQNAATQNPRKQRKCKKCGQPMRGHARGSCQRV